MPISTVDYVAFAAPLELAAAQAYQAAVDGGTLDAAWTAQAQTFLDHHQEAVTQMAALIPPSVTEKPNPVPDEDLVKGPVAAAAAAGDQNAALTVLAGVEDLLTATHHQRRGGHVAHDAGGAVAEVPGGVERGERAGADHHQA